MIFVFGDIIHDTRKCGLIGIFIVFIVVFCLIVTREGILEMFSIELVGFLRVIFTWIALITLSFYGGLTQSTGNASGICVFS